MSKIADDRERGEAGTWLRAKCDEVMRLAVADYHVTTKAGRLFAVQRKVFPDDFIASWRAGYLEMHAAEADVLIVEREVIGEALIGRWDEETIGNAMCHKARLAANMWVVDTSGPAETWRFLCWLEVNGDDLVVKPNKVRGSGRSLHHRILNQIHGVDSSKPVLVLQEEGVCVGERASAITVARQALLGDVLAREVDWAALYEALHPEKWPELPLVDGGVFKFKTQAQRSLREALVKEAGT